MNSARWFMVEVGAVLTGIALVAAATLFFGTERDQPLGNETPADAIAGNLGGVPVSIPKSYVNLVEYEDQPGSGALLEDSPPKRTFESRLRGFSFELRYPDMAVLTEEAAAQKRATTSETTTWMRVGISASSDYYGKSFLENNVRNLGRANGYKYPYEEAPEKRHGLIEHTPLGPEKSRRSLGSGHLGDIHDRNIYFHRNESEQVTAFIECSNMLHDAATCRHWFDLSPEMRATVWVAYRRALLPQWSEIQRLTAEAVRGFRVSTSSR